MSDVGEHMAEAYWITTELRPFPVPPGSELSRVCPPQLAAALATGVPVRFLGDGYQALDELRLDLSGTDPVVFFGQLGLNGAMGVSTAAPTVLEIGGSSNGFVNSSLQQFRLTVLATADRFPFYRDGAPGSVVTEAAANILRLVEGIDAPAAAEGTYWHTFVADLASGDLGAGQIAAITG